MANNNKKKTEATANGSTVSKWVIPPLSERAGVFKINAMREALVEAHNKNNTKAIDLEMCNNLGIAEESLETWKERCEHFRTYYVEPFVNTFFNESITDEQRKELEDKIFPEWKEMLKTGEEDLMNRQLHVDPYDIYLIFKYGTQSTPSNNGSQFGIATTKTFRKGMEYVIGLKMAMNKALTKEEQTLIRDYENAVALRDKKSVFLNGTEKVKGANDLLTSNEAKLDALKADIATLDLATKSIETGSDAAKYLAIALEGKTAQADSIKAQLNDLRKKIGNAKDCLDKSEKLIKAKEAEYEKLMAKIKKLA